MLHSRQLILFARPALRCVALGVLCLWAGHAQADFLRLSSGETFTGTLVQVKQGLLKFKTSLAGQVMAPMNTVDALESDRPFVLTLQDSSSRYGRFVALDAGTGLQPDGGEAAPVNLADVVEALEVPGGNAPGWKAEASLNAQGRTGIKDSLEPSVRLDLRGPDNGGGAINLNMEVDRADAGQFPAYFRAGAERVPGEGTGLYLSLDSERVTNRALEWRTGLTLGVGRWMHAWNGTPWLLTVGLQPTYERWGLDDLVAAEEVPDTWADRAESTGRLNLLFGARFGVQVGEKTEIGQRFTLAPDLLAPGDWRASSETELARTLSDNLRLRLHLLLEYTSDPLVAPADPWSASLGAGVAFEF
ncbi:MAG: DUF481 domain-containing protein [Candidatus Hydrogenedens sp.]|nr:DUF481 domain-containing protein [Candidatus Hydrogenedens sp.]